MKWNFEFGPASIIAVVAFLAQVGLGIWGASAMYSGILSRLDVQGVEIKQGAESSNKRFETVHTAIADTKAVQQAADVRMTRVETSLTYISSQLGTLTAAHK